MKLPVSKRLLACADLVRPGDRVADVGTDHGYLAIHLLKSGRAARVFAADVARQPLERARQNAQRYGIKEGISFYLSDGVQNLPREFDVLLCAGMGADTIIGILEAAPWLRDGGYRLILQCQSSQNELRRYLGQQGWRICREVLVRDRRFLYTVLEAMPGGGPLSPGQQYVSPALLDAGGPLLGDYLDQCRRSVERAAVGLANAGDPGAVYYQAALRELLNMEGQR